MPHLPPKPSMAAYAADALRKLLAQGEWADRLPGERALALRLGVSRPTLHQALLALESEGLLAQRRKAAWRIISKASASRQGPRRVVFLSPLRLEELDHFTLHQYTVFSSHLAEIGYEVDAVHLSAVQSGKAERTLRALASQLRPSAWVLHRCNPTTQRWFSQSGLAAVVMGSAPERARIRSVDVDYRAAARHAVSQLRRLGHEPGRIAYLMPGEKLIGHTEAVAGMREASGRGGPGVRVVMTEDRAARIAEVVRTLCREAARPTALILHRPLQVLTVLGILARLGLRVPEDISLVVLDDNPVLAHVLPQPARYHKDTAQFAAHLRRAIDHAIGLHRGGAWATRIVPELIPGDTLAKPPAR